MASTGACGQRLRLRLAYGNRADARLEFWERTAIPLLDVLSSALSSWLGLMFGQDLRNAHDLDQVPVIGHDTKPDELEGAIPLQH